MRGSVSKVGGLLVSAALVLACGEVKSSGDGGPADGGTDAPPGAGCDGDIDIADLEGCLAFTVCQYLQDCQAAFADLNQCMTEFFPRTDFAENIRRTRDAIAENKVTYDGVKAAQCLAGMAASGCYSFLGVDPESPAGQACEAVFTGTAPVNGGCFLGQECQTIGGWCEQTCSQEQCCAGVCRDPIALGSSCNPGDTCVQGAHCTADAAGTSTCTSGELGSPCFDSSNCDSDFWCDLSTQPGLCAADFAEGAGCQEDAQCPLGTRCVGEGIDPANPLGICRPTDSAGAPCDGWCDGTLFCNQPDPLVLGNCEPLPVAGESCELSGRCDSRSTTPSEGLYCDRTSQMCAVRKSANQPCISSGECQLDLFCTREVGIMNGTCSPLQADGLVCAARNHCTSGICAASPGSTTLLCAAYDNCYN